MRTMNRTISNRDDIIDSRDVEARISQLEGELEDRYNEEREGGDDGPLTAIDTFKEWLRAEHDNDDNDATELLALRELRDDCGSSEWQYGLALIADRYFATYTRVFAEDIHGRGVRDAEWPFNCIDWDEAAELLQQDYSNVEFDGITYWYGGCKRARTGHGGSCRVG